MNIKWFFKHPQKSHCPDLVREPMLLLNSSGRILDLNDSIALALSAGKEDLMGAKANSVPGLTPLLPGMEQAFKGNMAVTAPEQIKLGNRIYRPTVYPLDQNGESEKQTRAFGLVLQDITEYVNLEEELIKRNRLLMAINTISTVFLYSNIASLFDVLHDKILLVTGMDFCWTVVREKEGFAARGMRGLSRNLRARLDSGALDIFHQSIMDSGEPFTVIEGPEVRNYEFFEKDGIATLVAQPLSIGPDKVGVLVMGSRTEADLGFDMASLINLIGNHVSLIMEKVRLYEESERLAITDALTGLFNIRHFYDSLAHEIARARRYGESFSISIFDIDDFKNINDTFGHQAGDEVLRTVASAMKNISREVDLVARYGGEEFVIILPNTSKQEAFRQAARVKDGIETESYLSGRTKVFVSGGVASFPGDATDEKGLLYAADMALYEAKSLGKRQIRLAGVS